MEREGRMREEREGKKKGKGRREKREVEKKE